MPKSIHEFQIEDLMGNPLNFADFKGKKLLLVNVASECGLTPQYRQLQDMYAEFSDQIAIVGCPANNFGAQEPGSNTEIREFCDVQYGVKFPLTTKISVKGGDMHPLYQFVTQKDENGLEDSEVQWNFQKYVFDENGFLTKVIAPTTEPASDEVLGALGLA